MANNGKLLPHGTKTKLTHQYGRGKEFGGGYGSGVTYGESENNAVYNHKVDSKTAKTAFISTTKDYNTALMFATSEGENDGVIYVIDTDDFAENDVEIVPFRLIMKEEKEDEVLIKSRNGGEVSQNIIKNRIEVSAEEWYSRM